MRIVEVSRFMRVHIECTKNELGLKNEFLEEAYKDYDWKFVRSGPKVDNSTMRCVPNMYSTIVDVEMPSEHLLESQQELMQRILLSKKDPS